MITATATATALRIFLVLVLVLHAAVVVQVNCKELIPSYEWQRVGPTDTLPAGLEIRMDLSGGGKWARLPPKEINPPNPLPPQEPHKPRCGPSCKERQKQRAEKRRAAGFLLREPSHHGGNNKHRRQQAEEESDSEIYDFVLQKSTSSNYWEAGIFLVGLTIGLGVATGFRYTKRNGGLHES